MTRDRFQKQYNIDLDQVCFQTVRANVPGCFYRVAEVGAFAIFNEGDDYYLVKDGSVCRWRYDLGAMV